MGRHWTIRVRLTVLYGGMFLLAGAVLLGATYLLVRQNLNERRAISRGSATAPRIVEPRLQPPPPTVELGDGRVVPFDDALRTFRAEQERFQKDTLDSLLTRGGLALGGVGLVAGALCWLLAGRALQPVHRITETARRIAGADGAGRGLHERIALGGPRDEVTELADTFDAMLERLDRSFDGQRRFVANASHELRTPLAVNRALIEVAITRPAASADARELGEALLGVNGRHERLIDGMLTLADSENEVAEHSPVDLADVAGHMLDQMSAAAADAEVRLERRELAPAPTRGDPVLLERLAQNLVENAVRHNRPGGWLSVTTDTDGGAARLVVANTGPVVPKYEMETLFQPFRRLGAERAGADRGFGLGLSIARAVARTHGGDVAAAPRDGGGLVVTVTLPAVPAAAASGLAGVGAREAVELPTVRADRTPVTAARDRGRAQNP